MLYIASALPSTAVTHSISIPNLLPSSSSLVVAKGNVIAVYSCLPEGLGLVCEEEVWGCVVGLQWIGGIDQTPHIVVLTDHPLSRLLLYNFSSSTQKLNLTSHHSLARQYSRTAEYLTGLVADRERGLIVGSLYTGVLIVAEVGVPGKSKSEREGKKGKGKRKESVGGLGGITEGMEVDAEEVTGLGEMTFKDVYDIPIREHNLLSLAFLTPLVPPATPVVDPSLPGSMPPPPSPSLARPPSSPSLSSRSSNPTSHPPVLLFLHLSPSFSIHLSFRSLSITSRSFTDLCNSIDLNLDASFFIPAARRLLAIPGGVVVAGDEYCASWEMSWGLPADEESSHSRRKSNASNDDRVAAGPGIGTKLSPENSKRRRGSLGGSLVPVPGGSVSGSEGRRRGEERRKEVLLVKKGWRVSVGFGEIIAMEVIKGQGKTSAVLLGDEMGKLTMISYVPGARTAETSALGVTSAATSLSYLDSSHIFLGSQVGDSQLLSLHASGKGKGKARDVMEVDGPDTDPSSAFDVKDEWVNVAPIRDFCVVEEEGGGASQIVTASGASSTGSLRIVRSGVGMEVLAKVESLRAATQIYGIKPSAGGAAKALLISDDYSSFVFSIEGTSEADFTVEHVASAATSFVQNEPTLAVGSVGSDSVVQVTPSKVVCFEWGSWRMEELWEDPSGKTILVAECAPNFVALALDGGELVILNLAGDVLAHDGKRIVEQRRISAGSEIASLDITPVKAPFTSSDVVAVGLWGSNSVQLLSTLTLQPIASPHFEVSLPTSVRLRSTLGGQLELLVGLGDGTLVVYLYDSIGQGLTVTDRKEMALGRTPLHISSGQPGQEDEMLVALSDRASILFEEQDRLAYSSISGKAITAAAILDVQALGPVLISTTDQGLSFARITSLKKLHVRKVELGFESPHGIVYHDTLRVYGVALNKTTLEQEYGNEEHTSCFRLYDAVSFEAVAELPLSEGEVVVSLNRVTLDETTYFAIGTSFPGNGEPGAAARGRVRLVEGFSGTDEEPQFTLAVIGQLEMRGTVYDSKSIWGRFVVAVENRVDLIELDKACEDPSEALKVISTWGNAFLASSLSVQSIPRDEGLPIERLHVGDGMRSVFALELDTKNQLVDVGRDISPHWVMTLEELETEGGAVAFSDTSYNVLTMRHKDNQLENAAGIALHETVTRFRKGALSPSTASKDSVKSELLFATSSGRIGVLADVGTNEAKILGDLQRNMDALVTGPGMTWQDYREVHTEGNAKPRRTLGFIDGDFVKRFLDLSVNDEERGAPRVLKGANEFERVGTGLGRSGGGAERNDVVRVLEVVGALH